MTPCTVKNNIPSKIYEDVIESDQNVEFRQCHQMRRQKNRLLGGHCLHRMPLVPFSRISFSGSRGWRRGRRAGSLVWILYKLKHPVKTTVYLLIYYLPVSCRQLLSRKLDLFYTFGYSFWRRHFSFHPTVDLSCRHPNHTCSMPYKTCNSTDYASWQWYCMFKNKFDQPIKKTFLVGAKLFLWQEEMGVPVTCKKKYLKHFSIRNHFQILINNTQWVQI
jgi:hypothetical protein